MPKVKLKNLRGNAVNEQINAKRNIKLKKNILENWNAEGIPLMRNADGNEIRNAKGDMQLDYYPKSLSAFCTWNGSRNCEETQRDIDKKYGGINGTGRDTIRNKYPEEQEIIISLIEAVKLRAKQQAIKLNKGTVIDELTAENIVLKKIKEGVEIQYRQLQQRIIKLSNELNEERSAHKSSRKMWGVEVNSLEEEVKDLTKTNQDLTRTLAKVKTIGIVND